MAFKNFDKPSSKPSWAPANPADIVEPSAAKKALGFQESEYPPYQYFNWFWDLVSDWANFIDDQHNSKSIATTQNDTAAIASYSALISYLSSLPKVINHTITINCSGTGYTGNTVTFADFTGSGSIILNNSAVTEKLQGVIINNVDLKGGLSINSFDIDGGFFAITVDNSKNVKVNGGTFSNNTWSAVCRNGGSLTIESIIVGTGNNSFVWANTNGNIVVKANTITATNGFSSKLFYAQSFGQIEFDYFNVWSTQEGDQLIAENGGIVVNPFGLGNTDSVNITKNITTQAGFDKIHSYLSQASFIPVDNQLTISISSGTFTSAKNWDVKFYGGGTIQIDGVGTTNTSFNGFSINVEAQGFVHFSDFKMDNTLLTPETITVYNSVLYCNNLSLSNPNLLGVVPLFDFDYSRARLKDVVADGDVILNLDNCSNVFVENGTGVGGFTNTIVATGNSTIGWRVAKWDAGAANSVDASSVIRGGV